MAKWGWPGPREVPADLPRFCIVTPVFNGAAYIDDTIRSVLAQSGDFSLHYHVQDGGSTDDTVSRVRRWQRLAPKLQACRDLVFTLDSAPDGGMYDAVNKGMARALPPGDDIVMGWLGADDRLAPGACATIASVRAAFPDVRFMGGRISLIDALGSILGVHPLVFFSRRCLAAGLHDGRRLSFIMQEGSFWCADLWRKVGGLDARFRLAGDWDLWRRMAAHAGYASVDTLLGFHRRRPGQMSEQMDAYYAEVDETLASAATSLPPVLEGLSEAGALSEVYARVASEFEALRRDPPRFRVSGHGSTAIQYNLGSQRWDRIDGIGAISPAPMLVTEAGSTEGATVRLTHGYRAAEGPYQEFGLATPIRWMIAPRAGGEVSLSQRGHYRVILLCRSWIGGQTITLLAGSKPLGQVSVTPYRHDRDLELSIEAELEAGDHHMEIAIDQPAPAELYLLIMDWRLERQPDCADRQA